MGQHQTADGGKPTLKHDLRADDHGHGTGEEQDHDDVMDPAEKKFRDNLKASFAKIA